MSSIFDEKTMIQYLERSIPGGEALAAGIHGIGITSQIKQAFKNCVLIGEQLIPKENGAVLEVSKEKYAKCDVYIGITQNYLIVSECELYKHCYEFNEHPELREGEAKELCTAISIQDIGTCFPLADIQTCIIKKGWMGSVNCSITMKNGNFLKLLLPKLGGVGGGMPHHAEYREAILARLSGCGISGK